jgi:hypothetical protein
MVRGRPTASDFPAYLRIFLAIDWEMTTFTGTRSAAARGTKVAERRANEESRERCMNRNTAYGMP